MHALFEELLIAIRQVEHRSEIHSNESQHLAEGTEVARLRRRFSLVLQETFSFCTRHHLCTQGMALVGTQQLRSRGPVYRGENQVRGTGRGERGKEHGTGTGAERNGNEGSNRDGGGDRSGDGNDNGEEGRGGEGGKRIALESATSVKKQGRKPGTVIPHVASLSL